MFFWNSLAFSMIQQMLAIWFLVPLPFLYPACTSGISKLNCLYFLHNSPGSKINHLINNYTLATSMQAYYITKEALTEWISLRQSPSSKFNSAVTDSGISPSQALILSMEVLLIGGCDGNSCYPLIVTRIKCKKRILVQCLAHSKSPVRDGHHYYLQPCCKVPSKI